MSTFQVRYNVTRIGTAPIQVETRSHFGIVLPNEYVNNTVVKFILRFIAAGVPDKNTQQ